MNSKIDIRKRLEKISHVLAEDPRLNVTIDQQVIDDMASEFVQRYAYCDAEVLVQTCPDRCLSVFVREFFYDEDDYVNCLKNIERASGGSIVFTNLSCQLNGEQSVTTFRLNGAQHVIEHDFPGEQAAEAFVTALETLLDQPGDGKRFGRWSDEDGSLNAVYLPTKVYTALSELQCFEMRWQ